MPHKFPRFPLFLLRHAYALPPHINISDTNSTSIRQPLSPLPIPNSLFSSMARPRRRNTAFFRNPRKASASSATPSLPPIPPATAAASGSFDDDDYYVHSSSPSYLSFTSSSDDDAPPPPPPAERKSSKKRKSSDVLNAGKSRLIWKVLEEENNKWIDENIGLEEDCGKEAESVPSLVETMDPSPDVLLPLLRFQKEWLSWALKQEDSSFRGGILADEMGMGKTIQAISLVLTARSFRSCLADVTPSLPPPSSTLTATKCTLVICPMIAVIQWAEEILKYTKEGSAKVLVYHGAKRLSAAKDFGSYDFVLTTYGVVEREHREHMMPPKKKCHWCGKLLYPDKLKVHRKYFCGPYAVKTEKQAKQTRKKARQVSMLKGEDDFTDDSVAGASRGVSPLHSVKWERIILDEAHSIKARHSSTARAIFALESSYRWALSGTPLQNRVGELYSLVRFLQIHPYSFSFCQDCDCKALDHSTKCVHCDHGSSRHFFWWNRYIAKPVKKSVGWSEDANRALLFLRGKLLKSMVLRRTKNGRAADLALPPRIMSLRRDSLDKNEQDFYEALYNQSQTQFDSYLAAGTLMNNYGHIFTLLIRLRQAVDHPYLVAYSKTAGQVNGSNYNAAEANCGICHDPAEDPVVTSCEHVFCKSCLLQCNATLGIASCPSCSKPLTVDLTANKPMESSASTSITGFKRSSILRKLNLDDFKTSTKIDALKEEIRNMVEFDGSAKGIVFSQYTSFLDLISYSLQKSSIECIQLVGSMTMAEREKAIRKFTDDPNVKVFLMSLKAGGVALNLTVASHVFLMDPWWNPAVERQAQDRIHRIGQYKPIRVVRFVIKDTIEERILKLQEKKELVFEGTLGDSSEAMAKLTEADLRFLFQT